MKTCFPDINSQNCFSNQQRDGISPLNLVEERVDLLSQELFKNLEISTEIGVALGKSWSLTDFNAALHLLNNKSILKNLEILTTLIAEAERFIAMQPQTDRVSLRMLLIRKLSFELFSPPDLSQMKEPEGVYVPHLGTSLVKEGNLNFAVKKVEEEKEVLIVEMNLHHPGLKQAEVGIQDLHFHQNGCNQPLKTGLTELWRQVEGGNYQKVEVACFGSKARKLDYYEEQTGLKILIELGDPNILTVKNRLVFSLNFDEEAPKKAMKAFQNALFALGLGTAICPQRKVDQERIQLFCLNRMAYKINPYSYEIERDLENYDRSPQELRDQFQINKESQGHLKEKEIHPGRKIWTLEGFGKQMEEKGAYGLFHSLDNTSDTVDRIIRILTKGLISTKERFRQGVFISGQSSSVDMQGGGGDQVFTRVITKESCKQGNERKIWNQVIGSNFPFHFLINLEVADRPSSYFFQKDQYGSKENKEFEDPFSYDRRLSPLDVACNKVEFNNEFMVKNRIPPESITGFVVPNEKIKNFLINKLSSQNLIQNNEILGIKVDNFFHLQRDFVKRKWWRK